jgi:hypothetical protein
MIGTGLKISGHTVMREVLNCLRQPSDKALDSRERPEAREATRSKENCLG